MRIDPKVVVGITLIAAHASLAAGQDDAKVPAKIAVSQIKELAVRLVKQGDVVLAKPSYIIPKGSKILRYNPGIVAIDESGSGLLMPIVLETAAEAELVKQELFKSEKDFKIVIDKYHKIDSLLERQVVIAQKEKSKDKNAIKKLRGVQKEVVELAESAVLQWASKTKGVEIFLRKDEQAKDVFVITLKSNRATEIRYIPETLMMLAEMEAKEPRWIDVKPGEKLQLNGVYIFSYKAGGSSAQVRKVIKDGGVLEIP